MYVVSFQSYKSRIHRSVSSQHDTALIFYSEGWTWFYAFYLLASASVSKENLDIISSPVRKLLHATLLEIVMNSERDVMNVATMPPASLILCLHLADGNTNKRLHVEKEIILLDQRAKSTNYESSHSIPTYGQYSKEVITFSDSQRNI